MLLFNKLYRLLNTYIVYIMLDESIYISHVMGIWAAYMIIWCDSINVRAVLDGEGGISDVYKKQRG